MTYGKTLGALIVANTLCFPVYLHAQSLPPPPTVPLSKKPNAGIHQKPSKGPDSGAPLPSTPAENVPHGKELVSIDFPNGVNLSDMIRTISVWSGKNFVLGQGVSGGTKISIISQEMVTKEEAYQAFLSALNISGFTTVETGKVIKILPIANAKSANIKTYYGANWSPETDEVINHVVPLRYIEVNNVINQLRTVLGMTQYSSFTTTNSLILTDTGHRIRKLLEVIKLLDEKTSQSQVSIVPINYTDARDMALKIADIFGAQNGSLISLQKALVDERTNSLILVGPAHTLDDVVRFVQRVDRPSHDESSQAFIRVRPLDYANAEKVAQTLQALMQNTIARSGASNFYGAKPSYLPPAPPPPSGPSSNSPKVADISGAKITADAATNSIIIQGSKAAYNELDQIIAQLDRRRAQIYLEAHMIDLNVTDGLQWTPAALGGGTSSNMTVPFGFNALQAAPLSMQQTASSSTPSSAFSNLGANAFLGILSNKTISLGGISLSPGALIFALKTDSNNNVLQTPSMMVSDNETADFKSAQEYNFVLNVPNPSGTGTVQQQNKYDATTGLKITPQISRSDFVNLKINLQLDNIGSVDANGVPTLVNKRSAESVVTVQNGQTAVLGGITTTSMKRSESKVPLLGEIPVLGWLFKQVINSKEKTSLTLLITPYVVRDSNDLAKIYDKKTAERDEFLKAFYGENFAKQDFYSQYPKPEDGKAPPTLPSNAMESVPVDVPDPEVERPRMLPSQEHDPINAPMFDSGATGAPAAPAPVAPPAAPAA